MNCSRYLFICLLVKYSFLVREITGDIHVTWYCLRDRLKGQMVVGICQFGSKRKMHAETKPTFRIRKRKCLFCLKTEGRLCVSLSPSWM